MAPHHESPLSQPAVSGCPPTLDWSSIDDEVHFQIAPVHTALACDELGVEEAGELFSELLASHLQHHGAIRAPKRTEQLPNKDPYHSQAVVRLTERLGKAKNVERRQFRANSKRFLDAVHLHNRAKKASKRAKTSRST